MEYTVRSTYAQMPPLVIKAASDRRAVEQAQELAYVVGSEVVPALEGNPPSESGEIGAFAVLRDGEVIYRGLVALKGAVGFVGPANGLVEDAQNWLVVNADTCGAGRSGVYRVVSVEEPQEVLAGSDGDAMDLACELDLRNPDQSNVYETTPFAVFSEEDGHLAGIGLQCIVEDADGVEIGFSKPADYLLGWFECIEAVWSTAVPDAEVETVQVEVITSLPRQPQIPTGVSLVTQDEDKHNPNVEALRILRATLMEYRRKELLDKGATRKEAELGAREWLWARLLESVNKNLRPQESSG